MAQSGFTPLIHYYSTTASAAPLAANMVNGELAINITDGKLYYKDNAGVVQIIASKAIGTIPIPIASGGTNATTVTQGGVSYGTATAYAFTAAGTSGQLLTSAGTSAPTWTTSTNANTASAVVQRDASGNFSAGTITASLTGNSTGLAGGAAGSLPYQSGAGATTFLAAGTNGQILTLAAGVPTWAAAGTSSLATNLAGGAAGSLPYQTASNTTTFLAAGTNGQVLTLTAGVPAWAAAGVTSVATGTGLTGGTITTTGTVSIDTAVVPRFNAAGTFTTQQTFAGSSSALACLLTNAAEVCTVSATAATGTINYDVTTQSVLYYTSNASANWTPNFRASSGTTLNTAMATGQSITAVFMVTQGSTAYYSSAVQVDGSAVTPKWQGGTAPTSGNASSIDVYSYTIIKTGSAAFTVLASQTKFA